MSQSAFCAAGNLEGFERHCWSWPNYVLIALRVRECRTYHDGSQICYWGKKKLAGRRPACYLSGSCFYYVDIQSNETKRGEKGFARVAKLHKGRQSPHKLIPKSTAQPATRHSHICLLTASPLCPQRRSLCDLGSNYSLDD